MLCPLNNTHAKKDSFNSCLTNSDNLNLKEDDESSLSSFVEEQEAKQINNSSNEIKEQILNSNSKFENLILNNKHIDSILINEETGNFEKKSIMKTNNLEVENKENKQTIDKDIGNTIILKVDKKNKQIRTDNLSNDKHQESKKLEFQYKNQKKGNDLKPLGEIINEKSENMNDDFRSDEEENYDSCSSLSCAEKKEDYEDDFNNDNEKLNNNEHDYNTLISNNTFDSTFPLHTRLTSIEKCRVEALYNLIDSILSKVISKSFIIKYTVDEVAFSTVFVAKKLIFGLNYTNILEITNINLKNSEDNNDYSKLISIKSNSNFLIQYIFEINANIICCNLIEKFVLDNKNRAFKCFSQYFVG